MSMTTDIRKAVQAELKFDPLVDDADIRTPDHRLTSSTAGTGGPHPRGPARSLDAAVAAAWSAPGVNEVEDRIAVEYR